MTPGKTLAELWNERPEGVQSIRVRRDKWGDNEWFQVMGVSPAGHYYGYHDHGVGNSYYGNDSSWHLVEEKPKRPKLEAWMAYYPASGTWATDWIEAGKEDEVGGQNKFRVPQFDVEGEA